MHKIVRSSLDKALTARKKERRARLLKDWKDLLALRERRLELLRQNVALGLGRGATDKLTVIRDGELPTRGW